MCIYILTPIQLACPDVWYRKRSPSSTSAGLSMQEHAIAVGLAHQSHTASPFDLASIGDDILLCPASSALSRKPHLCDEDVVYIYYERECQACL